MSAKRILFCAESVYQLFNAVNLRLTVCEEDCVCDLILSNLTDWEEGMLERLANENLFENIIQPQTKEMELRFWDMTYEERITILDNPILFFDDAIPPVEPIYDTMFVPIDHIFWKMLYHYHVVNGKAINIIMYDEGVRTYTMNMRPLEMMPYFQKSIYAKAMFIDAIKTYYVYQPDLYTMPGITFELKQLPSPLENEEVKNALIRIYGYEELPMEPYIYLEDVFFVDRCVTNDLDLFKQIGDFVGKDNIIVKQHPRDDYNRFSALGYKTLERSVVPWEVQLLANDITSKVLISVSSTAMLSPYLIFNSDMHIICLEKMCVGETKVRLDAQYWVFFEKMVKMINEKEVRIHTPSTTEELEEALRYIKLVQYRKKQEREEA